MLLVVDANIVFSTLLSKAKTFDIFLANKFVKKFGFIAPEFLFIEINKHFDELVKRTKLSSDELSKLLKFIRQEIDFIPFDEFKEFDNEAQKISPDPKDVPYFALALKFSCSIWSNDKLLKKQNRVKVLSTSEIAKLF